jgi:hypothetical protein
MGKLAILVVTFVALLGGTILQKIGHLPGFSAPSAAVRELEHCVERELDRATSAGPSPAATAGPAATPGAANRTAAAPGSDPPAIASASAGTGPPVGLACNYAGAPAASGLEQPNT